MLCVLHVDRPRLLEEMVVLGAGDDVAGGQFAATWARRLSIKSIDVRARIVHVSEMGANVGGVMMRWRIERGERV